MQPLVTIIVVTHNSARWLERQRAALDAQTETRWRLTIIDNASRGVERPNPGALPPQTHLIQSQSNDGFAAANNRAAADASGPNAPYLVFLNPDAFPQPEWLAELIATAERFPDAGAVGSTQIRADAPDVFDGAGDVLHASGLAYRANHGRPRKSPPPLGESFAVCAAAMLVRREAFEQIGGFDDRYFCFFEDVDLCFRLRLAGWRVLQSPDAIVDHVGGGVTGVRSAFAQWHGARNRTWTFIKCMPGLLFWALLPAHIAASALVATANLSRGLAAWRGLIAAMTGIGPIWRTRQELQKKRRASVYEIARMLAWSPHVLLNRQSVIRPLRHHEKSARDARSGTTKANTQRPL